ncbi:hypothetical protein B7P43_G04993 [Cryptotermes secundus]|uniref:Uncharacterized protein n=2 Tax=Cryptotermes secundus TaxID=105785 RepID=A0A2J7PLU1_9NEOP|nr:hypothetical protein B7P43_G04993 [Cryptotermes secundus]
MVWKIQLLLFLAATANTTAEGRHDYPPQLMHTVNSLNKLLDYMLEPRSVIGDMIFGVVLARGQLAVLRRHLAQRQDVKMEPEDLSAISILENKCEEIYRKYMPIRLRAIKENYDIIVDNVVREELWDVDYPLTFGKLRKVPRRSLIKRGPHGEPQKLTSKQRLALLLSGRPNETESDSCISLLIHPQLCGTSPSCWNIMANKDEEIHGYSLTHRLLYLQIARQLGCGGRVEFADSEAAIRSLCSDILVELKRIVELQVPAGFWDLFLEEVSLCGMEGFAEFLNPLFIDWILPLQTPAGCFADRVQDGWLDAPIEPPALSIRRKREDGDLGDGCTMHITGMAAIFLALNIRATIEIWNPDVPLPSLYREQD